MTGRLLSVAEAAKRIGIGRDAMYALVHSRQVNVLQVGRSIHIPEAALDELLTRIATQGVKVQ